MIYLLPTDTCYGMACPIHDLKSYDFIYKVKKRDLNKPLAIMVPDFKWLLENTDLTSEQIEFLENYDRPFTVLTECNSLKIWINYIDEDNNEFINRDLYEKFAFRVANNSVQKRLIKENGPMFLTSANISKKPEIYIKKELKEEFAYYLEKGSMQLVGENMGISEKKKPSDIFEFEGESLKINYLRKN